jgi:hypothetical protein
MCRSRPPPGIMELVTEANTAAENEAKTRADDEVDQAANEEPQASRKRFDKTTLALSLLIAIGLVLVGRGLAVSLTGDARAKLPDTIEEVDPYPEAVQVLSQTRVFVDLDAGYTGVLVIDGVELPTISIEDVDQQFEAEPGQQIDLPATTIFEPGNYTLTFTPSDDALVKKFDTGLHRAQVIYWKIIEGRQRPLSYSWTFSVI